MKRLFFTALLIATVFSAGAQSYFKVASFNMKYDSSSDKARGDGMEQLIQTSQVTS